MKILTVLVMVAFFSVGCASKTASKCGCGESCAKDQKSAHSCGNDGCTEACAKKKS
jgi:hypothetical protein